jgi:hypothetical protein
VPWSVGLHRGVWPPSEGSFTGFSFFRKKKLDETIDGDDVPKLPTKFQLQQIRLGVYLGLVGPPGT